MYSHVGSRARLGEGFDSPEGDENVIAINSSLITDAPKKSVVKMWSQPEGYRASLRTVDSS